MQPLVSIVLCSYNGALFIEEQIETLIGQTYKNIEIIICDDNSTDDTISVTRKMMEKDSRISLYLNEKNIGLNKNFEKGFSKANGEFIAVCDQDDIWREDKIEELIKLFVDDDQILLCHGPSVRFKDIAPTHIQFYNKRNLFKGNNLKSLFYFNTIAGHNIIFRKKLLDISLPLYEDVYYDWWLVFSAALFGKIMCTNKVLTYHRYHVNNVTLGKNDERYQTKEKAEERKIAICHFLKYKQIKKEDFQFGNNLLRHLSALERKKFSWGLFYLLLKNSRVVFFFKKSSFPFFSLLKISYRQAWAK